MNENEILAEINNVFGKNPIGQDYHTLIESGYIELNSKIKSAVPKDLYRKMVFLISRIKFLAIRKIAADKRYQSIIKRLKAEPLATKRLESDIRAVIHKAISEMLYKPKSDVENLLKEMLKDNTLRKSLVSTIYYRSLRPYYLGTKSITTLYIDSPYETEMFFNKAIKSEAALNLLKNHLHRCMVKIHKNGGSNTVLNQTKKEKVFRKMLPKPRANIKKRLERIKLLRAKKIIQLGARASKMGIIKRIIMFFFKP